MPISYCDSITNPKILDTYLEKVSIKFSNVSSPFFLAASSAIIPSLKPALPPLSAPVLTAFQPPVQLPPAMLFDRTERLLWHLGLLLPSISFQPRLNAPFQLPPVMLFGRSKALFGWKNCVSSSGCHSSSCY